MTAATQSIHAATRQLLDGDLVGLRERAAKLASREIQFIPNPEFGEAADTISGRLVEGTLRGQMATSPADLPSHLRRLCESELLTHEQERMLFREMNHIKFRADALRLRLDLDQPDPEVVATIESLLARSELIRDHIIKANMRLVMSIVKKFVTPLLSFDDMLSDGAFTLMQAVDKFDFDRGFRFSTYAYRAIARNAYRCVTSAHKDEARFTRDAEGWAFEQEDDQSTSTLSEHVWSNLSDLTTAMLARLDRRERFIIRCRYALGGHRKVRTFQCLADKLGISKERARQLEKRAVAKLQAMAAEFEADDLFSAAMA